MQQSRPRRRRASPGSGYDDAAAPFDRRRRGGEEGEGSGNLYEDGAELELYASAGGAEEEDANDPFFGLTMREVYGNVSEAQSVFPMRRPRPKGCADARNAPREPLRCAAAPPIRASATAPA